MASTGCGGGCFCNDDDPYEDDDDYGCGGYEDPYYGVDARIPDFGVDSGATPDRESDAAMPRCVVGEPCAEASGCPGTNTRCFEPATFGDDPIGLGGSSDPIRSHPDGEETFIPTPRFPGGYCTTSWPEEGATLEQCNVRSSALDSVCGDCAVCIDIFGSDTEENTESFVPGFCARRCSPSLTSNECRSGYECLLTEEACFIGCQSHDECRIRREETNGIPGIQTPSDCGTEPAACTPSDCGDPSPARPEACATPELNFDGLAYDTASAATCDPATSRCVNRPSTPTAAGGDPCTEDSDCEPGGRCIAESDDGSWVGGTCTKDRCDLPGNECANGGVCDRNSLGYFACFEGCTVGGFDTASDPSSWVGEGVAQSTCRDGYGCYWSGLAPGGEAANGVCLPLEYNPAVTTPNVGAPCTEDANCFSPFGLGFCLLEPGLSEGHCSVSNCAAPWFTEGPPADQNICGDGALCVSLDEGDPTFALCLQECSMAEDCGAGLGCVELAPDRRGCWFACDTSADCRLGERCTPFGCVPE